MEIVRIDPHDAPSPHRTGQGIQALQDVTSWPNALMISQEGCGASSGQQPGNIPITVCGITPMRMSTTAEVPQFRAGGKEDWFPELVTNSLARLWRHKPDDRTRRPQESWSPNPRDGLQSPSSLDSKTFAQCLGTSRWEVLPPGGCTNRDERGCFSMTQKWWICSAADNFKRSVAAVYVRFHDDFGETLVAKRNGHREEHGG